MLILCGNTHSPSFVIVFIICILGGTFGPLLHTSFVCTLTLCPQSQYALRDYMCLCVCV